jgi:hypothetical protein
VGVGRNPTVPEGIFVPEEAVLVAGPTQLQSIAKGLDGAEGVEHQVHLPADALADGVDDGDLVLERRGLPAVNFIGGIAHLKALLREVSVRFRATQTPWLIVAQVGAGVAGQLLLRATQ